MRLRNTLRAAVAALAVMSCSDAGPDAPQTSVHREPITYGQPDSVHTSVVLVFQQIGQSAVTCGGTIVAVKGQTGFLLTAAHCVAKISSGQMTLPPEPASIANLAVIMDDNYLAPNPTVKEIFEVALHPDFDGISHAHDLAMVRFGKLDPGTVPVEAMSPAQDDLQVGTVLDLVGYGATETSKYNSVRRHVEKPISALDGAFINFDQSGTTGGACEGDSGGPALTLEEPPRVAGVVSGGASCTGTSLFGRVSGAYDSFIAPFIDKSDGQITCTECFHSSYQAGAPCADVFMTCFDSKECTDYGNCVKACSDAACVKACDASNAAGQALYASAMQCMCASACEVECKDDAKCVEPPACGLQMASEPCGSCADGACCEQEQACAADGTCALCEAASAPDAACAKDSAYVALMRCLGASCPQACGVSSCGLASGGACQACVEASCCEVSLGCSLDSACAACRASSAPDAGCGGNEPYAAWESCVAQSCGGECAAAAATGQQVGVATIGGGCAVSASGGAAGWLWTLALLLGGRRRRKSTVVES